VAPGPEVREASHQLGTFSPRLGSDLADLAVRDAGDSAKTVGVVSRIRRGHLCSKSDGLPQEGIDPCRARTAFPEARLLDFSGCAAQAVAAGAIWGPGRVYSLGARRYSRETRDQLRNQQRLLPLHEIALQTATLSALQECGNSPLWIRLHLDILQPHLVPGVIAPAAGGASLEALRAALESIPGERVAGFEILGYPQPAGRNRLIALTAAELLRDNILVWWARSPSGEAGASMSG
jgi:hypothetical protein